jgi:hypothetical protein
MSVAPAPLVIPIVEPLSHNTFKVTYGTVATTAIDRAARRRG